MSATCRVPRREFLTAKTSITGIVAVLAETRHTFPRHTHDQFGIGVIERGAHKSHSNQGMVEAGPGDTITVNPGEVHDGSPIGDAGRAWRMIYLDPALVAETIEDATEGKTALAEFSAPVLTDKKLASRFRELFDILTTSRIPRNGTCEEEQLLLLLAATMNLGSVSDIREGIPQSIAYARSRIDDDPAASLTLAELAEACGLSRFQLLRSFSRATGLTPHAYLVQRRLQLARRLIVEGVPLTEASIASGFADQSHMTRTFVRTYGISPRAYLEAAR